MTLPLLFAPMKALPRLVFWLLLFGATLTPALAQSYIWTGVGNGWQGQVAPPNDGTADLSFVNSLGRTIPVDTLTNVHSLTFSNDNDYVLTASAPTTLTGIAGINTSGSYYGNRLKFDSPLTLQLPGVSSTWAAGYYNFIVSGKVTGTGPLALSTNSDGNGSGSFVFNNSSAVNDYTGGTTIASLGPVSGSVAFWNSTPFGTGAVNITNGAFFAAHNTLTVANNFTVTSSSTNPWSMRTWDAPLTFSGAITLASNAVIATRIAFTALPGPDNEGSYPIPGPVTRNPTIFTGNVGQASAGTTLTIGGPGIVILKPTTGSNTYSGGTTVNGTVIFGNNNAIPTGPNNVLVNIQGYAGLGDTSSTNFANQLGHLDATSGGALGVDTLPGNSTITYSDPINLSTFTNTNIRIGTATSAILNGVIAPQGTNYQFGNGGGSLFVLSPLSGARAVSLNNNSFIPLKLYLQGSNTYTGGTTANNGFIIFDGASSVPAGANSLKAATTDTGTPSLGVGGSYIGFTDVTAGGGPSVSGAALASGVFSQFDKTNTWGIVGLDTHTGNATIEVTNLDLTGFNDGVFLGTATSAALLGTITTTSVTNANNAANTLRVTAGNGGTLTIDSQLTGTMGLIVGSPSSTPALADGTVILANGTPNTYSGGTILNTNNGITLTVGTGSLGSGTLSIAPSTGGVLSLAGLGALGPGVVIPNAINFQTPDYLNNSPARLALVGTNDFTLSGNITSGPVVANNASPAGIFLYNSNTLLNVTLSGDNSGYKGDIEVVNDTLTFANNSSGLNLAAGQGTLYFSSPQAKVVFSGPATTEYLYGIKGSDGTLTLPGGSNLIIKTDNASSQNSNFEFGGIISGAGASLTIDSATSNNDLLYLYGHNTYSGGTMITGQAALGLGQNDSAGSGVITINAIQGGLALNNGVTLTNAINFTAGGLAGLGTFSPAGVNGDNSGSRTITFGTNQKVMPGLPDDQHGTTGTLTIAINTAFANGGTFALKVQDPMTTEGHGLLAVGGSLDLTSLSTNGFMIELTSLDANGLKGGFASTINWGQSYIIPFVHANGGIVNSGSFNPANFTFDVSNFQGGVIPASAFSVTADSTQLYLNFTAVPEPSTYALMAVGLGVVALPILRRRRA